MPALPWSQAVDIGLGRGRLAPAAAASLARVDRDMRSAFGRAADINEAWRSPEDADKNYAAYLRYLRGGPWAPIALPGDKSVHCFGFAVDTDDTSDAQMRIWNDHGWFWTVYRDGKLVERWHLEYFPERDNHRNESIGQAATDTSEEDDMRIIYSQHLDREFLIGDGGITHLTGGASKALNAIGISGNRFINQLGKDDFRMAVEAHGLSYEQTRLLPVGKRLLDDGRVLDAGNVPWGPRWA
jgi:hypothetical protein